MFRNRNEHGSIRLSGCNHVLASSRVNFCSAGMRVCISSHEHARTVLLNYSHKLTRTCSSTSQDGRDPEAAKLTEFGILSEATFRAGVSKRLASLRCLRDCHVLAPKSSRKSLRHANLNLSEATFRAGP